MDMENPNGVTKTEIDYILTDRPDIVTDITVINQVNIASGKKKRWPRVGGTHK